MNKEGMLWEICMDIYRQVFKEAEPSGDFDKMIKSGETKKDEFYMNYYLPDKRLMEIIDIHCRRNKMSRYDSKTIKNEIVIGCSPTGCRKRI